MVTLGDHGRLTACLLEEVHRLATAGAHLGLFASNTPHLVFEEIEAGSPIPLVSIVEAAARAGAAMGLKRVGLLGTRFTVEGGFYPPGFLTTRTRRCHAGRRGSRLCARSLPRRARERGLSRSDQGRGADDNHAGGFTTFSAFAYETYFLGREHAWPAAFANRAIQGIRRLAALAAGHSLATG